MVPKKVIREILKLLLKIQKLNLQAYLAGAKQPHNFHGKGERCFVLKSLKPQFGSSHQFESYRQKLPMTAAKTELN